ncbi:hypothetical protein SBOR_0725 [Sclerotinia borealis F-4128]|uniref:Uncharacterized protein n=1 Tax=Sclerotinia borealis (strain F-4128) TaxID=1432307 RepID=W9CQ01_SCLBF|nr:hypothetical protein SBOR_0725 [Sclerotinia borealis F-4128]
MRVQGSVPDIARKPRNVLRSTGILCQYSTIILKAADSTFSSTLGAGTDVTHTDMETADEGITWIIAKIAIPPMITDSGTSAEVVPAAVASSSVASASHAAVSVSTSLCLSLLPQVSYTPLSHPKNLLRRFNQLPVVSPVVERDMVVATGV